MNPYIGHASQLGGAEMHRLVGGKGDGMRLLELRNGLGLEMTLCPDRALDISRLLFKGVQMSYMSPCGYVAPAYYESTGTNWLKSFTAGFLTTCGLQAVGSPCQDAGEELPLHGAIAHQPCEQVSWEDTAEGIRVRARILDETIFGRKLALERTLLLSRRENAFTLTDRIENTGDRQEPLEILYHMNMGYPLLSEESLLRIPSCQVTPGTPTRRRIWPIGCICSLPPPAFRSAAIITASRTRGEPPPFSSLGWAWAWKSPSTPKRWTALWNGK